VIDVPRERLGEAVGVLARAFAADPLMDYLFGGQERPRGAVMRDFFRFSCEVNLQLGWLLLGLVLRTRLAAVACISRPDAAEWPEALTEMYRALARSVGKEAAGRIERYAALVDSHLPRQPMFYVSAIGVRPESHGRSYGRLLEEVHARASAHPRTVDVGLDTENPNNVPLYKSLGYHVAAEVVLDDLRVWCMFRPNEAEREVGQG
jgi:ribosomal protein S18 acetylase RimI-like enzyme